MADFQTQAMGLTGLTIDASSTDPSRVEFSQFLNDGVIDVTTKWLAVYPEDRAQFIRESSEQTSNGSLDLNGADIVSIIREDGVTSNNWRPCRRITPGEQYLVTDTESLSFASKFSPTYMIGDNGKLSVFPAPGSDPNAFKVYYINNSPEETDGTSLDHASTGIKYFPSDKIYLVVLYASMKSLQAKISVTTISDLSITAVPPDVPSITSVTFTSIDSDLDASLPTYTTATVSAGGVFGASTAPDYVSPTTTISGISWATEYPATEVDIATPLAAIVTNVDLANGVIDASPVPPEGATAFSLGGEFDDAMAKAKALIDTATMGGDTEPESAQYWLNSEDTEMVTSTIQVASQELQRANLGLQDATQTFSTGLSKFSADVQEYQAEVAEMSARAQGYIQAAQGYASEITTRLSATRIKIDEYQARAQDALNVFNEANASFQGNIQEAVQELQVANQVNIAKAQGELQKNIDNENRSQQRQFQNAVNDMKAITDNNASLMQKFATEIQEYQAEVGTQVQEYTQNLQADTTGYQWLQEQYARLKADYDLAFIKGIPPQGAAG